MTSNVSLSITYTYYPMPPLLKQDTHHIITPSVDDDPSILMDGQEGECIAMGSVRLGSRSSTAEPGKFDAGAMDSDLIAVELEVAPSVLCLYGSLLRNFLHVKVRCYFKDIFMFYTSLAVARME